MNDSPNVSAPISGVSERELNTLFIWYMTRTPLGREGYDVMEEVTRRLTENATLRQRLAEAETERNGLRQAIDRCCQCRWDDGPNEREQYEECHFHACQRHVCMENGDPSETTLEEALVATTRRAEEAEAAAVAMRAALEKICDEEGRVCDQYEICQHRACASSHRAWELAAATLASSIGTHAAAVLQAADEWERTEQAEACRDTRYARTEQAHREARSALAAAVRQLRKVDTNQARDL